MSTADKLTYLNNTKSLLKDRLNSLGAEITSSTTFRNYLTWLDTFYGDASNKTDLSTNGIVGRTSQESTTGKNKLLITASSSRTDANVTGTYNETDGSFTISGTANSSKNAQITSTIPLELEAGTYTFSIDHALTKQIYLHFNLTGGGTQNIAIPAGETEGTGTFSANTTGYNIRFSVVNEDVYNETIKMQLEDGSSATNWEKFTFGASPNPSYEQPINNLSGNVAYKVGGAQLYDYTDLISSYSFLTYDDDGWYTITYDNSDSATGKYLNFTTPVSNLLDTDTDYLVVTEVKSIEYTGLGSLTPVDRWGQFATATSYQYGNISNNTTYTAIKTTKSDFSNISGGCLTSNVYVGANSTITITFRLSLIKDTSVTPSDFKYEPYIEPQTFTIPLGDIELCDIDTYEDKIYSSDGRFYLRKENGKVVLNGSEEWSGYTNSQGLIYFYTGIDRLQVNEVICNKLVKTNNMWGQGTYENLISGSTGSRALNIMLKNEEINTVNKLLSWLPNNNLLVYYPLATSTTTEITSSNYPELYAALKEIQDYLTSYKINKEFILGYSSPTIDY